ncbi:hypothetical protein HYDPIDRAFT_190188 [Hydnomerulius pinastri MD-312]|uniref:CUE domain-containing protein n=1 Tax=Hydnomerulius pinastri MD-312 TaxID=994086 RepID=A0A0C9W9L6_9AGAM|nr:hypothetical protein HYDPIDRAFT_190188 [Hydnomerulius pinastri MD-312]
MILSPSPPPQPLQSQPQPPQTEGAVTDPRIAPLKGMFPDFDDAVILSVLESTNNDPDRALDVLLGMNDPSYVPPPPPPAANQQRAPTSPPSLSSQPTPRLSQEALDEQLAQGQRGDEAPKSYYDPNARGYDLYGGGDGEDEDPFNPPGAFSTSPSNANTASNAIGPSANAKDTTPTRTPPPTSAGSSTYVPPASWNTRASSPPVSSVQRPPSTGSGSPGGVDFSKLGLLPKRPISLVRPQSPPGRAASSSPPFSAAAHPMARAHSGSEDDDELEYVENPFEERGIQKEVVHVEVVRNRLWGASEPRPEASLRALTQLPCATQEALQ